MRVIFVLDDQSVVVSTPEDLKLIQLEGGFSAIAIAGKNEKGEDAYRPLISFPVKLVFPSPEPEYPTPLVEAKPVKVNKKRAAKKAAKKRTR